MPPWRPPLALSYSLETLPKIYPMTEAPPIKLRIPRQDQPEFNHFAFTLDGAERWVQALPLTNTRLVVEQLVGVISNINRHPVSPEIRFAVLEALRPTIHMALVSLGRRFLNQPIILPPVPAQMAALADQLNGLVTTAYTIVAVEGIQQRDVIRESNPARLVGESLHRAISWVDLRLLQCFQLYQAVELGTWLELHQLYALAERQRLHELPVADDINGHSTVTGAYLRALLLGCAKPNQLRQADLAALHKALWEWTGHLRMHRAGEGSGLFLVNLTSDEPPNYANRSEYRGAHCRLLDTTGLVEHLRALNVEDDRRGHPGLQLSRDHQISSPVLDHLLEAYGEIHVRDFARVPSNQRLWVSLGLPNTHFFASGSRAFGKLLGVLEDMDEEQPASANPFLPGKDTVREDRPSNGNGFSRQLTDDEKHPSYPVRLLNVSPGGYCLEWSRELPGDARSGDILSVREDNHENWSIAVVRWVSRLEDETTLLGVELLSPTAKAYGARVLQKTGTDSQARRVLLLPEIALVGQAETIITPSSGFREKQKLTLVADGEARYIQLQRQVAATAAFQRYEFRPLQYLEEVMAEDKAGQGILLYDSIWSNI